MTSGNLDWRARRERNLRRTPPSTAPVAATAAPSGNMDRVEDAAMDARARRRRLLAKMPERSQRTVERLERVRAVYVRCGRDNLLDQMLTDFHELILTEEADGTAPGGVFFITGESGAGKTSAIREMLHRHPVLQPEEFSFGTAVPYVSISLKGATTLHLLARRIMTAAGYPIKKSVQGEIWDELSDWLKLRDIHLVHIDETQHLMRKTEKDAERKSLADALKGAMNHVPWPVSFILSGLPQVTELARLDEQFERRNAMIKLPDIGDDERSLIVRIITSMAAAADLDCQGIVSSDMPERIGHSVRHRYGRICQAVFAAIHVALKKEARTLERDHFALAYLGVSHARGHDEQNVFLVNDWRRLAPGAFILPEAQNR